MRVQPYALGCPLPQVCEAVGLVLRSSHVTGPASPAAGPPSSSAAAAAAAADGARTQVSAAQEAGRLRLHTLQCGLTVVNVIPTFPGRVRARAAQAHDCMHSLLSIGQSVLRRPSHARPAHASTAHGQSGLAAQLPKPRAPIFCCSQMLSPSCCSAWCMLTNWPRCHCPAEPYHDLLQGLLRLKLPGTQWCSTPENALNMCACAQQTQGHTSTHEHTLLHTHTTACILHACTRMRTPKARVRSQGCTFSGSVLPPTLLRALVDTSTTSAGATAAAAVSVAEPVQQQQLWQLQQQQGLAMGKLLQGMLAPLAGKGLRDERQVCVCARACATWLHRQVRCKLCNRRAPADAGN